MNYMPDHLLPNEKVLCAARVHPAVFLRSTVAFLFTLVLCGYGFSKAVDISAVGAPASEINTVQSFPGLALIYGSGLLFLFSVWLGLQAVLRRSTTEWTVTNRRLIAKTGVFSKHTLDLPLSTIERVIIRRTLLGRLLHLSNRTIMSTDGTQESFPMMHARTFACDCCTLCCSEKEPRTDRES